MDITILKNGRKHGPFPEATVIAFLKSGRLVLSDVGCREGCTGWTPLSQLLGQAVADVPPPLANSISASRREPGVCPDSEILRLARLQKILIWVVLASLASLLNIYAAISIAILTSFFMFQIARTLRQSAWLYALGAFVPLISIILLLGLNSDATAALRNKGIRVGLLGAKQSDLDRFKAPSTATA